MKEERDFKIKPLNKKDEFTFSCYPGISCFNQCCREIDVILTPFDILRLKQELGISSTEFLKDYCLLQNLRGTNIPLVKIKAESDGNNSCRFLSEKGCKVYEVRPMVCRSYPVGLAVSGQDQDNAAQEEYRILEDFCKGHLESKKWDLDDWKQNQGVDMLEPLARPWMELVSKLKKVAPADEEDKKMELWVMVAYDLDCFRSFVFGSSFLQRFGISEQETAKILKDDRALLELGLEWLRFALFKEGRFVENL